MTIMYCHGNIAIESISLKEVFFIRMNASDITKKRQYCTLQNLYKSTIFQSTTYTDIKVVSSILNYTNPNSTASYSYSYTSTINNVPLYVCSPTFVSYEMQHTIRPPCSSVIQWKPDHSTVIYSYNTIYSSISTPNRVRITSTMITTGTSPSICSDLYPLKNC